MRACPRRSGDHPIGERFLDSAPDVIQVAKVMHSTQRLESVPAPAVYDGARSQAIHLEIAGGELMVSGRFDHWVPVAAEGGNPDEGAVQIFFDVTGMARPQDGEELFSFHATEVDRLGPFAYIAKGVMKKGELEEPMEAVVQTPPAHTPFVVVTFSIDRKKFSEIWQDLTAVVATRDENNTQLHPRAWLKVPSLASA
jgi:hypothetical protein